MGKRRREARLLAREADAPRREALLRAEVQKVKAANRRTQAQLAELRRQVPEHPACCSSCWLTACVPEYDVLAEKAERQATELQRLEEKLALLHPTGEATAKSSQPTAGRRLGDWLINALRLRRDKP